MIIKRVVGCAGVLACFIACRAVGDPIATVDGDEPSPWVTGSIELEVLSGNLWHGILLNDEPVFQPSVTLEALGFGANLWANYDFTDAYSDEAPAFTEVDYTLYYSFSVAPFNFTFGYSTYTYPNTTETIENADGTITCRDLDDSQLVYGYVEMPDLLVVPSLLVEYTFESEETIYAACGLTYERELSNTLTAEVGGTLAWGNADYHRYQFDVDKNALSEAKTTVALIWQPTTHVALTASLTYAYFVDSAIADGAKACGYDAPDALVGGLKAGFSF